MATTEFYGFFQPGIGDGIKNGRVWGAKISRNFGDIDALIHDLAVGKMDVVSGGSDGQIMTLVSGVVAWASAPSGLPTGGSDGQMLGRAGGVPAWVAAPSGLPAGGGDGQILGRVSGAPAWVVAPTEIPGFTPDDYGRVLSPSSSGLVWAVGASPPNITINGSSVSSGTVGAVAMPVATPPSAGVDGVAQVYAANPNAFTLVPNMTSNTAPSGVASAKDSYASVSPYLAYNSNGHYTSSGIDGWVSNSTGFPTWLQYQFPAAMEITSYSITPSRDGFPGRVPSAWTLLGSNDGSSWTTLDTQTGLTTGWTADVPRTFAITSATYAYYRINITNNYAGNGGLPTSIRFLALGGPNKLRPSLYVRTQAGIDKLGFDVPADALRVYLTASTNSTSAGNQKVPLDTVDFDSNGIWDSVNKRAVPKKAGYYIVNIRIRRNSSGGFLAIVGRNGIAREALGADTTSNYASGGTALVYCNGIDDYIEAWIWTTSVVAFTVGSFDTYMEISGPI